jgi:hypothetical protein
VATDTIEFEAPSGMALTIDVFPEGSDAAAFTGVAAAERANDKGTYRADVVDPTPGVHRVNLKDAGALVGKTWVRLANGGGVHLAGDRDALLPLDAAGRVDVGKVAGTAQTARDLGAQLDAAVSSRAPELGGNVAAIKAKTDLIPAAGPPSAADWTAVRAALLDRLDAAISSRLAAPDFVPPDNAGIANAAADAAAAKSAAQAVEAKLPAGGVAIGSATAAAVEAIEDAVAALNDLSAAEAQYAADAALAAKGYSAARATNLDRLDAAVASRAQAGDAMALTAAERLTVANALLDLADGIEAGLTPRGALRLALAALAGKLSGAGTGTETFRSAVADAKDRIVASVDAQGNRTAVAVDAN